MAVANLYCSRADVNHRLPVGSIVSPAGLVASSPETTNVITLNGHGFETGDAVTVRAIEGGTLSAPLVEGTTYYVRRLSNSAFELAATSGGPAIDLTSDSVSMVIDREPAYDEYIEFYSRWADTFFPAHRVPLPADQVPDFVRGLVADLAAKRLLNVGGQDSAILRQVELDSKAQLERFASGMTLRGTDALTSANLAITDTLGTVADQRGWGSGSLP